MIYNDQNYCITYAVTNQIVTCRNWYNERNIWGGRRIFVNSDLKSKNLRPFLFISPPEKKEKINNASAKCEWKIVQLTNEANHAL